MKLRRSKRLLEAAVDSSGGGAREAERPDRSRLGPRRRALVNIRTGRKHSASKRPSSVVAAAAEAAAKTTPQRRPRVALNFSHCIRPGGARSIVNQPIVKKQMQERDEISRIKSVSRIHSWHWNQEDKSHECLVADDQLEVCFHPQCSESAAAIRGSEPLIRNGNYYYWEVTVLNKTYGTSVMFGVCTKRQRLHANDYCNLVGLDREGWSLSHKGLIWHNGIGVPYTNMFPANQTVTVGILFNSMRGELSFFMDGQNLGVAFCKLNETTEELYPVIGSTAKCTQMRLTASYCGYMSLLERSCFTLLNNAKNQEKLIENLQQYQVPRNLIEYLAEAARICDSQTEKTAIKDQYDWSVDRLARQC